MSARLARAGLGGLAALALVCPDALADETHGDVNLPALTPEEIQELGLESAPPTADTTAPGAQDVDAGQIPDNQDEGTPAPEEAQSEAGPEVSPPPSPPAPPPAAAPAPPPPAAPPPVAPVAAPPAPAAPVTPPAARRSPPANPRQARPPAIGRQPQAPVRRVPVRSVAQVPAQAKTAAPAAPASEATRAGRIVRAGESLWSIAADLLGPGASPARIAAEVERLWRLNRARIRTGNPDVLPAGTALRT